MAAAEPTTTTRDNHPAAKPRNNWVVITGGPACGKTTLLKMLAKKGFRIVPEAARTWIDQNLEKGIAVEELRKDEQKFQEDVTRLKMKIESELDPATPTFFDRGMHDSTAYMKINGFKMPGWMVDAVDKASYRYVFILNPLPIFKEDYARIEDKAFATRVSFLLEEAYRQAGFTTIRVPAMPPRFRVKYVLSRIDEWDDTL